MKIIKWLFYILIVIVIIIVGIGVSTRMEGNRMYEKYASYTQEVLEKNYNLKPSTVKEEYQHITYPKAFPLFDISVNSYQSDRLGKINSLDATMFFCMKMFTLMIRPDYGYNLPVLSVDFIFTPFGGRVYVIEIIDPAKIADENKKIYYGKMKSRLPEVAQFESTGQRDWYKDFVTDFSIHKKTDRKNDDLLFDIYKTYLNAYIDMAKNAKPLTPENSKKLKQGLETYVSTLLSKGGPAVDVFKQILGPEGQQEYVRSVMFGID